MLLIPNAFLFHSKYPFSYFFGSIMCKFSFVLVALTLASLYELFQRPLERHEIAWPPDKEKVPFPDQK